MFMLRTIEGDEWEVEAESFEVGDDLTVFFDEDGNHVHAIANWLVDEVEAMEVNEE